MPKTFEKYLKLRRAIQDWCLGTGSIMDIAHVLNLTYDSAKTLMVFNGLADVNGRPEFNVQPQDVFNMLFLSTITWNRDLIRQMRQKR